VSQEIQNIIIFLSIFGIIGILTIILLTIFVRRVRTTIETRKQVREEERYREITEGFPSVVDRPYEGQLNDEELPPRIPEKQDLR
jgi:hypothetical protein